MDSQDIRLYIFDADGTLRRCTVPNQPCPNQPGEWELMPGVAERLAQIDWENCYLGVASNQGGVGLGFMEEQLARDMLLDMVREAIAICHDCVPGCILLCPHAPKAGCECRKPKPGMLLELMENFGCSPEETLYVGDMESDKQAAEAAGVRFAWAKDFFGWEGSI